jgi:putative pre-16S rRNA nuclease
VVLADLVAEVAAVEVVVGLPVGMDGREGRAAATAREYAEALAPRVAPVPVRLVDERLSTVEATRGLRAAGRSARRSRAVVDQAAAVVILQHALDAERGSGRAPGVVVGSSPAPPAGGPGPQDETAPTGGAADEVR